MNEKIEKNIDDILKILAPDCNFFSWNGSVSGCACVGDNVKENGCICANSTQLTEEQIKELDEYYNETENHWENLPKEISYANDSIQNSIILYVKPLSEIPKLNNYRRINIVLSLIKLIVKNETIPLINFLNLIKIDANYKEMLNIIEKLNLNKNL